MSDLPRGWEWATLDDLQAAEPRAITDGPFGSNLTSAHYTDGGARVIRLQNIGDGDFVDERAYISLEHYDELKAHDVRRGDLVIASLGNNLPRACIVPALEAPAIVKADCIRVRLHESVDSRWILKTLISPESRRYAATRTRGVGRPRLGLGEIRKIPIPVPPLAEQRRIVAALDVSLDRIAVANRAVATARVRALSFCESLTASLIEPYLGQSRPLRSVLSEPMINGRSVPSRHGGFPVLRLTAVKGDVVDASEFKEGDWDALEAQPFLVREGDFLVSRGNGSRRLVGRGGLVEGTPRPVAFPDTLIRVRVDQSLVERKFLSVVWNSRWVRRQIEAVVRTTAGIYKINQSLLGAVEIPVPSLERQREVVESIGSISEVTRSITTLEAARKRSAGLRSSLLAEAFAGRLVEQDPADEPASELLARIRAQRVVVPKQRGRRTSKELAAPATRAIGTDFQQGELPL
ncbi:restriction endonuclease subunit S [Solwaraspora sp. WMMA2101]|uniref:restriction endonuclease subunit S n=1 Tax=Solwaraspora sp. WMMA2101 TaxID=3404124 RepID=UPI003B930AF6